MIKIVSGNSQITKIPGIFHDTSPENEAKAAEFLHFLISHEEIGSGPKDSFTMAIFRDSLVSKSLLNPQMSLEEIILENVPPSLKNHPDQLENLLFILTNDRNETLKYSSP